VTSGTLGRNDGLFYDDANGNFAYDAGEGIWANDTLAIDVPDLYGRRRNRAAPCRGAVTFSIESNTIDAAGRIAERDVNGSVYAYEYTGFGQLVSFTDHDNPGNNASYVYDHAHRRVEMTVGATTTRMVYDGQNVVADLVDENGDGAVDRQRVYWRALGMDTLLGFVYVDVDTGATTAYYTLTDQVGSVVGVTNEAGELVSFYDYDAFGNLRSETSYEGVALRYRFQGREWDAHSGMYYFRMRSYLPEYGAFTGPDLYGYGVCGKRPASGLESVGALVQAPNLTTYSWR
jgi:RHS repeat-associated protein